MDWDMKRTVATRLCGISVIIGLSACAVESESPTRLSDLNTVAQRDCSDWVIARLGIPDGMMSDPAEIQAIIKERHLEPFASALGSLPSESRVLYQKGYFKSLPQLGSEALKSAPILNRVAAGIQLNQPKVAEYLCIAEDGELIPEQTKLKPSIKRAVHNIPVLNAMVAYMAQGPVALKKVYTHLLTQRRELLASLDDGGRRTLTDRVRDRLAQTRLADARRRVRRRLARATQRYLPKTWTRATNVKEALTSANAIIGTLGLKEGAFEAAKTITMDWVLRTYLRMQEQAQTSGAVQDDMIRARQKGTSLNILEAVLTDFRHDLDDNAFAGVGMILNPALTLRAKQETNYFIEYLFEKEWEKLYQTWNMGFVVGNVDELDILLPKLLIPLVVAASPTFYMGYRVLALWLSIDAYLIRIFSEDQATVALDESLKTKLARPWGKLNFAYAEQLQVQWHPEAEGVSLRSDTYRGKAELFWQRTIDTAIERARERAQERREQ